jgi:hypothetical protein
MEYGMTVNTTYIAKKSQAEAVFHTNPLMSFRERDQGTAFHLSLLSSASCLAASLHDVFISNAARAIFICGLPDLFSAL